MTSSLLDPLETARMQRAQVLALLRRQDSDPVGLSGPSDHGESVAAHHPAVASGCMPATKQEGEDSRERPAQFFGAPATSPESSGSGTPIGDRCAQGSTTPANRDRGTGSCPAPVGEKRIVDAGRGVATAPPVAAPVTGIVFGRAERRDDRTGCGPVAADETVPLAPLSPSESPEETALADGARTAEHPVCNRAVGVRLPSSALGKEGGHGAGRAAVHSCDEKAGYEHSADTQIERGRESEDSGTNGAPAAAPMPASNIARRGS